MNKILNALDFLQGYKLKIASSFTFIAVLVTMLTKVDLTQAELAETLDILLDQSYVIYGAIGMIYGAVMKIVRKFRK